MAEAQNKWAVRPRRRFGFGLFFVFLFFRVCAFLAFPAFLAAVELRLEDGLEAEEEEVARAGVGAGLAPVDGEQAGEDAGEASDGGLAAVFRGAGPGERLDLLVGGEPDGGAQDGAELAGGQ